jgi:hypothetical protein
MDECKNNFLSTWSFVQLLCFLMKLFGFTILIHASLLISLSTNYEDMVKAWSWKFSWVILKVLVGISFLWVTRLLVEVCNVQNEQKKTNYNNVQKHYKWRKRRRIETWCIHFQWTSCLKAIGCQQTIKSSCW